MKKQNILNTPDTYELPKDIDFNKLDKEELMFLLKELYSSASPELQLYLKEALEKYKINLKIIQEREKIIKKILNKIREETFINFSSKYKIN